MRVLGIVHQPDAGAGVFADAVGDAGHELVEWQPDQGPAPDLAGFGAALVFGGAMHVDSEGDNPWMRPEKDVLRDLLVTGVPLLGICLGAQLLAEVAGAAPRRAARPEIGWTAVDLTPEARDDPLLGPLPERIQAFQWHSYEAPLPAGAVPLARSPVCLQAYRIEGSPAWGLQFHAEVTREEIDLWLEHYTADEDAMRIGLDPEALRAESAEKIDAWNEVGRGIADRFLVEAASAARLAA